ncbi:MAG: hypothetical protein H7X83_00885 [Verrucomicrobia bacterium]|nr:hypothetical protein [Deltaproteobacteria bacterium]
MKKSTVTDPIIAPMEHGYSELEALRILNKAQREAAGLKPAPTEPLALAAAEPGDTQHDCPQCEFYRVGINGIERDEPAEIMNRVRVAAAQAYACRTGGKETEATKEELLDLKRRVTIENALIKSFQYVAHTIQQIERLHILNHNGKYAEGDCLMPYELRETISFMLQDALDKITTAQEQIVVSWALADGGAA